MQHRLSSSPTSSWMGIHPLLLALVCLTLASTCLAFGAGNIPSFAYLEGKAFRHGDLEDTLKELLKSTGGFLGRGSKFGGLDIKRVYMGNWLRDYSQAMDIAGLKKLSKQTILNLIMGLGFLAHGYATGEFEVTEERLGVYLPTEHIDNPKGYGAEEPGGDARRVDPRLRGPVEARELQIDPRTGMKNYIANESIGIKTSAGLMRERITQCIAMGRRARQTKSDADQYESLRLLGTLLHTLEDFTAHSNWCELSLRRLGYLGVFCHVGDACLFQTPGGMAPPLVTGTFGGADFLHSLLGEATDHISEASVSDLSLEMNKARTAPPSSTDSLASMLLQLPGSDSGELTREMNGVNEIRSRAASSTHEPTPQELHATLFKLFTFRDNVVKSIERTIENIPGLSSLVEKLTDSINRFIFQTLEVVLKPVLTSASSVLVMGSAQVLNNADQFAVFNDPHADDPTHSFLAKDHFITILNEPAGKVAMVIVEHAVTAVVKAWGDESIQANEVVNTVLETFHHPYYFNPQSSIQRAMAVTLKGWIDGQRPEDKSYILDSLSKENVKLHNNVRKGHRGEFHPGGCHGGGSGGGGGTRETGGYGGPIPTTTFAQGYNPPSGPSPMGSYGVPPPQQAPQQYFPPQQISDSFLQQPPYEPYNRQQQQSYQPSYDDQQQQQYPGQRHQFQQAPYTVYGNNQFPAPSDGRQGYAPPSGPPPSAFGGSYAPQGGYGAQGGYGGSY